MYCSYIKKVISLCTERSFNGSTCLISKMQVCMHTPKYTRRLCKRTRPGPLRRIRAPPHVFGTRTRLRGRVQVCGGVSKRIRMGARTLIGARTQPGGHAHLCLGRVHLTTGHG